MGGIYKTYRERGGKRFGPYYYTTVRTAGGKTKGVYLGRTEKEASANEARLHSVQGAKWQGATRQNRHARSLWVAALFALLLIALSAFFGSAMTGRITLSPQILSQGSEISGTVTIGFGSGDFLPDSTVVRAAINGLEGSIPLSKAMNLLGASVHRVGLGNGEYANAGSTLGGSGDGYGIPGLNATYPWLAFTLNVSYQLQSNGSNATETSSVLVNGVVSKDSPYSWAAGPDAIGLSASVLNVSRQGGNSSIGSDAISVDVAGDAVTVTTSFSESSQGFGPGFETNATEEISFPMQWLGLTAPQDTGTYELDVELVYQNVSIANFTTELTVQPPQAMPQEPGQPQEQPEPALDSDADGDADATDCQPSDPQISHSAAETCGNGIDEDCDGVDGICMANATAPNATISMTANVTANITANITTNMTAKIIWNETIQHKAVIGRPVKWTSKFRLSAKASGVNITVPAAAENMTVSEIEGGVRKGIEEGRIKERQEPKGVSAKSKAGYSQAETNDQAERKEFSIEEEIEELEIEYYTPGPEAVERVMDRYRKEITIYSGIHYQDVLAFTTLPSEALADGVRLFRTTAGAREPVQANASDTNGNGLADYVEWLVPHLSNETYELIIEISKAEHLDENRSFISDIYGQVKAQDGNWSEPINNNEYVRATFRKNLTSDRDITIYARPGSVAINGTAVPYDIYLTKKRIDEIRVLLA